MLVSKVGLDLIKEVESFSAKPYLCPAGKPTIGFGCTYYENGTKVTLNDSPITEERANEMLEFIANKDFGNRIQTLVKVPINQNQLDAMTSLAYNIGIYNFQESTLLKKLNQGDYKGASEEFPNWRKSGGVVLAGLVKRREKEKELFLKA